MREATVGATTVTVILALGCVFAFDSTNSLDVILVTLLACLTITPLCLSFTRPAADVFEPLNIFCVGYFLIAVVAPAAMMIQGTDADIVRVFTFTLFLALLGGAAFLTGYYYYRGNAHQEAKASYAPTLNWESPLVLFLILGAVAIGTFGFFIYVRYFFGSLQAALYETAYLNYDADFLRWGPFGRGYIRSSLDLLPSASFVWFLRILNSRVRIFEWLCFAGLCLFTTFVFFLVIRARLSLLALFVGLAILYHYKQKPFRWKTVAIVALICLIAFVFTGHVRQHGLYDWGELATELTHPRAMAEEMLIHLDAFGWSARSVVLVDIEGGHSWGSTFASFVALPVPTYLWPDKPTGFGRLLYVTFIPGALEVMNVGPFLVGELYYNFGIVGVCLGMFAFGAMTGTVYRKLRNKKSELILLCYAAGIFIGIAGELRGDFTGQTRSLVTHVLPVFTAVLLLRRLAPLRRSQPEKRPIQRKKRPAARMRPVPKETPFNV